jgi:hypothetical protein
VTDPCDILPTDALTREQYALRLVHSEPEMVQAGVRGARNSPAEQSGDKSDRVAPDIRADEWTDGIRGVVAQLGEHLHGMQGVGGSSPPSSTTLHRSSSGGTAKM